jgi:bacillithiol biosynthesis cysteine-adding enzyme BshC
MRSECLPVQSIPHLTALYRDYLSDYSRVAPFYAASPHSPKYASSVSENGYPRERRNAVADVLDRQNRIWGASANTLANVERLRKGAAAMVTGQQVVLFGGPMFAILKALTAIKHADAATKAGVDCVPVFWLASEDHDLAEVSTATFLDQAGNLRDVRLPESVASGKPVGNLKFDENIRQLCEAAAKTFLDADVASLLRDCYKPGESFTNAFAKLFTKLFADFGLILLDPAEPELHSIATRLLMQAAELSAELNAGLLARAKELEAAGYHAQVKVTNSSTVLFTLQDGMRTVVHRANGHFSIGKEKMDGRELVSRIKAEPSDFSGNALFRPLIQDYLLPTLAYVGGPAEVAYFAQSAVLYEKLLGRATPILPRVSATLIDAKAERLLKKYGLSVPDVFVAREELRQSLSLKSLPATLSGQFESSQGLVQKELGELAQQLRQLDPTLEDAAKHSVAKMMYQLSRLKGRAAKAEARKNADIVRHAKAISDTLFPKNDLQERSIAGISLVGKHGAGLVRQLYDSLDLNCPGHLLLYL